MPDPDRDPRDEKIERLEAELKKQAESLFTSAPHPGPVPEILRNPPPNPHTPISTPSRGGGGGGTGAALGRAFAIATNFVIAVVVMGALGWLVDWWRGTGPWFMLGGLGVGLIVGFYRFIKEALAASRQGFGERPRRP